MVDDQEKRTILSRARALVFPVRWHEPFGVAITEALASGCGVYGTPYGSLPEIVTEEVGGLASSVESLAQKIREGVPRLDAQRCRARVVEGPFTAQAMAEAYLRLYEKVLSTGAISESQQKNPPRTQPGILGLSSKSLLPWG
jgi:glycosyltransferase involved in cell wall biosynthesis